MPCYKKKLCLVFLYITTFLDFPIYSYDSTKGLKLYKKGLNLYENKKYQKAISIFKQYNKKYIFEYNVRNSLYYLAESYSHIKQYFSAIKSYNILYKRYPNSRYKNILDFKLGATYFLKRVTQKSIFHLEAYLQLKTESKPLIYLIRTYYYLGFLFLYVNKKEASVKHFQQALALLNQKKLKTKQELKFIDNIHNELVYLYTYKFKNNKLALKYIEKLIKKDQKYKQKYKFLIRDLSIVTLNTAMGLAENAIADIAVDGDDIWIATWTSGLYLFSRSSESLKKIHLPNAEIRSILVTSHIVYICTYGGIFLYKKKSSRVVPLALDTINHTKVFRLAQKVVQDDRYLFFSTLTNGVIRLDLIKKSIAILNANSYLKTNQVYAMDVDLNYTVFGSISNGVIIYNKKNQKVEYLDKSNSNLPDNNIKALLLDGRYLWIGIHKYGIYKFDLINKKLGKVNIPIKFPTSIKKRDHEIWIASLGRGIYVFNQKKQNFQRLSIINGLSSNDITVLELEDNYIWIGSLDKGIDIMYKPLN